MEFTATRFNGGKKYAENFAADSLEQARSICDANGWRLEGELIAVVPFDQTTPAELDALCARRNAGKLDS